MSVTDRRAFSPIKSAPQLSIGIFIGFSLASLLLIPLVARAVTVQEESHFIETSVTQQVALSVETASTTEAVKPLSVRDIITQEFGANSIMYWVALNESGLDPSAESGTGPVGLFQIARQTWLNYKCTGNRINPTDSARCAHKIKDANGLTDWRWSKYHGFDGGWAKHLHDSVL